MPDETAGLPPQHWWPTEHGADDLDLGTAAVRPITDARRPGRPRADAHIVIAVRQILDQRHPAETTIRAIKEVVTPYRARRPVPLDPEGWPILGRDREADL